MRIDCRNTTTFANPRRQRGMIAMVISLIVMMATLLAVVSLMRSTDMNTLILGTIGFKQGVVQEAERAFALARTRIPAGRASEVDAPPGYYASVQPVDAVRGDLPAALTVAVPTTGTVLAAGATGNSVRYVIERLCSASGGADNTRCVVPEAYVSGGTNDETASDISRGSAVAAYRLTVRVDGPRRARAYVQTIIR